MALRQIPVRMHSKFTARLAGAGLAAACLLTVTAAARNESWTDTGGTRFKGEPIEVLGPFALFRTSSWSGRLVLLHLLRPEDCVRFYQATRARPARAADWSQARGDLTQELFGNVKRLAGARLVRADLKGRPEPEFLILFFADQGISKSWDMVGSPAAELYASLQQKYPGMVEAVFWAPRNQVYEQENMVASMKMPWLAVDNSARLGLVHLRDLAPAQDFGMKVVSRDGVPVLVSGAENPAAIRKVFNDLDGLLALMQPDDLQSRKDRAWYLQAIQPVAHANDRAAPVLVGDPLKADALKRAGIEHLDAVIRVAASGRAVRVSFPNGAKDLKPEMAGPIGDALMEGVFVPAVDHGRFVDGDCEYHFGPR